MPQEVEVTETYWCPGIWPWQWFNTCTTTKTEWCYNFSWVKETGYLVFSHDEGCEDGILYSWYAFSFGIVGTYIWANVQLCFGSLLSSQGQCSLAPGSTRSPSPTDTSRLQASVRRRLRLRRRPR